MALLKPREADSAVGMTQEPQLLHDQDLKKLCWRAWYHQHDKLLRRILECCRAHNIAPPKLKLPNGMTEQLAVEKFGPRDLQQWKRTWGGGLVSR